MVRGLEGVWKELDENGIPRLSFLYANVISLPGSKRS